MRTCRTTFPRFPAPIMVHVAGALLLLAAALAAFSQLPAAPTFAGLAGLAAILPAWRGDRGRRAGLALALAMAGWAVLGTVLAASLGGRLSGPYGGTAGAFAGALAASLLRAWALSSEAAIRWADARSGGSAT